MMIDNPITIIARKKKKVGFNDKTLPLLVWRVSALRESLAGGVREEQQSRLRQSRGSIPRPRGDSNSEKKKGKGVQRTGKTLDGVLEMWYNG